MLFYGNIILSALYLLVAINYIVLFHIPFKGLKVSSRILLLLGIFIHCAFLVYIAINEGRLALTTVFEVLSMLALLMSILLLALEIKTGEKSLGAFIFPLVFCLQFVSLLGKGIPVLDDSIISMPLLSFHTLTTVIGYTCFLYTFILAIMYLYLLARFKNKKYDKIFFGLPPLDLLEKLNIIILIVGFVLMSIGLVTGGFLSILIWQRIPFEDPKIYLTLLLWFIYLLSLLSRFFFKLRGKTMSYTSIIGFVLIIVIIMLESLTNISLHSF